MPSKRKRKRIFRKFNGKKFRLWATADTKVTAIVVARAKRNQNFNARITKTKDRKEPYRIWIRAKGR